MRLSAGVLRSCGVDDRGDKACAVDEGLPCRLSKGVLQSPGVDNCGEKACAAIAAPSSATKRPRFGLCIGRRCFCFRCCFCHCCSFWEPSDHTRCSSSNRRFFCCCCCRCCCRCCCCWRCSRSLSRRDALSAAAAAASSSAASASVAASDTEGTLAMWRMTGSTFVPLPPPLLMLMVCCRACSRRAALVCFHCLLIQPLDCSNFRMRLLNVRLSGSSTLHT